MNTYRGFSGFIVLLIIALVAGGAFLYVKQNKESPKELGQVANMPTGTSDQVSPWKEYSNPTYGFSFKYPSDWKMLAASGGFIVSVAPGDYVCREGTDCTPPDFQVRERPSGYHPYDQDRRREQEVTERMTLGLDSGWSEPGMYTDREVISEDGRFVIQILGGTQQQEDLAEQILATFVSAR